MTYVDEHGYEDDRDQDWAADWPDLPDDSFDERSWLPDEDEWESF